MPYRKVSLVTGEFYHVYNRGVGKAPIFKKEVDYYRFIELLGYYRFVNEPSRFAVFKQLDLLTQIMVLKDLEVEHQTRITLLCYCLMPNHFHLLLRQDEENGITRYIQKVSSGYSHYYNLKNQRTGVLFESNFKAVRLVTEEQFIHLSRYIHLNPYVANIANTWSDLVSYPYSSLEDYLEISKGSIVDTKIIMTYFSNSSKYLSFVKDYVDYKKSINQYFSILHDPK